MKRYVIEIEEDEDGRVLLRSHNIGFNVFELIGLLNTKSIDLQRQAQEELAPDRIKRQFTNKK